MAYFETDFKHYELDPGEVEKLIEIWTHFNKKDKPYPIDKETVFINDKNKCVNNYQLMFNLLYPVLQTVQKVQTFYTICLHLRTESPVKYITDHFIRNFKTKEEKKEDAIDSISEDKPKKPRAKKK